MVLSQVFERFVHSSPVSVMVRGLLEKILSGQKLDELFERNSKTQYTRELLFSSVVEMMSSVTCGIRPFDASMLVHFRTRISANLVNKVSIG